MPQGCKPCGAENIKTNSLKLIFYLLITCLIVTGCSMRRKVVSNEDIRVSVNETESYIRLEIKNIGLKPIAIGVTDSLINNDTSYTIQIGKYSHLQTFLTDYVFLEKNGSHKLQVDNINKEEYQLKLIYTEVKDEMPEVREVKKSTTLLFPDGKFLNLKIKDAKVTSFDTENIY